MKNYLKLLSRPDILIISLILSSAIIPFLFNKSHTIAHVYKDNRVYCEITLTKNYTIPIDTLATLQVKDGKVRFSHSTCKNQICVKQGWSDSKALICVPNNIYVDFQSKKEEMYITY